MFSASSNAVLCQECVLLYVHLFAFSLLSQEFAVTVSFHLEPDTQEGKRSWCWVRLFHDVKKRLTATPFHAHVQQCLHKDEKLIWRTRLQQSRRRERNDTRSVRPLCLHSYTHFYSLVYFGLLKVQMQETLTYVDCHVLPLELPEFSLILEAWVLNSCPHFKIFPHIWWFHDCNGPENSCSSDIAVAMLKQDVTYAGGGAGVNKLTVLSTAEK
ncbi:uncharacterized protein [Alexandromys fortis]|uniref:uncharacterized protein isoform X2 n=1 Tax=Alexandromys fortis TaxID=100897 RepID=UPI0021525726|nr:uncharacterized protein LOC126487762 isoform X2 [Microtus fortis]